MTIRLQPVALDWMRDEDPQLLFPGADESFEVSPVDAEELNPADDPDTVEPDFESFKLEI